jgi:tetratricopeptide (TPR) repeat protein
MKATVCPPLTQIPLLFEALALHETGRASEVIAVLELIAENAESLPRPDSLLLLSLARSLRAHALADLDQHQQALSCLEEALSLVDPMEWLKEQVGRWHPSTHTGQSQRDQQHPPLLSSSFEDFLACLPAEASDPILLCCKAEGLYAHHLFDVAASLLGFACIFDTWRGLHTFPRAFYASNCALAAYKAGDCDLALDDSAAALSCLEADSPLAAPLLYNRAALLWDLDRREEATELYHKVLACDATNGRACLAQRLSAEQIAGAAPPTTNAEPVARHRATHANLYDAPGWPCDGEADRPRIWIPVFAAWSWQAANCVD